MHTDEATHHLPTGSEAQYPTGPRQNPWTSSSHASRLRFALIPSESPKSQPSSAAGLPFVAELQPLYSHTLSDPNPSVLEAHTGLHLPYPCCAACVLPAEYDQRMTVYFEAATPGGDKLYAPYVFSSPRPPMSALPSKIFSGNREIGSAIAFARAGVEDALVELPRGCVYRAVPLAGNFRDRTCGSFRVWWRCAEAPQTGAEKAGEHVGYKHGGDTVSVEGVEILSGLDESGQDGLVQDESSKQSPQCTSEASSARRPPAARYLTSQIGPAHVHLDRWKG